MDIYKRKNSKFWLADFTVDGQRFRKSTGVTTKTKAMEVAAGLLRQAQTGTAPARKGPMPVLSVFVEEQFLPYIQASQLDSNTKRYYETGWRLLSATRIAGWRLDRITTVEAELFQFPGTGSTANCALRTVRRILSLACEWKVLQTAPRIKLRKEKERTAVFTAERERAFLGRGASATQGRIPDCSRLGHATRRGDSDALGQRSVGQESDLCSRR